MLRKEILMMSVGGGQKIKQVACSSNATWFINGKGELYGCGSSYCGQQGDNNAENSYVNINIFTKRADNVAYITCSDTTTWYITKSGELFGCGNGYYGQQGNGSTNHVLIFTKRADNVKYVSCDSLVTWYLGINGELFGCGDNNYSNQGAGSSASAKIYNFTKRASNVKKFICENDTTWYINNSLELYGCGANYYGQQGGGDTSQYVYTFTKKMDNVVDVVCRSYYNNILYEMYAQLGIINTSGELWSSSYRLFSKIADNVSKVFCSYDTMWYIDTSGNLYGKGNNNYGQQGSGEAGYVNEFTKRP